MTTASGICRVLLPMRIGLSTRGGRGAWLVAAGLLVVAFLAAAVAYLRR
jgi:hypothetical protein